MHAERDLNRQLQRIQKMVSCFCLRRGYYLNHQCAYTGQRGQADQHIGWFQRSHHIFYISDVCMVLCILACTVLWCNFKLARSYGASFESSAWNKVERSYLPLLHTLVYKVQDQIHEAHQLIRMYLRCAHRSLATFLKICMNGSALRYANSWMLVAVPDWY